MSDQHMMKLAGDVPAILAEASQHMRKLATQNVELQKRASIAEEELRRMKIARRMEARNLEPQLSLEEKMASLASLPTEKLATLEQAVEIAAGGVSLARLEDDKGTKTASHGGELYSSQSRDSLDEYVLSQQAFG